jgi:hypothetical protein
VDKLRAPAVARVETTVARAILVCKVAIKAVVEAPALATLAVAAAKEAKEATSVVLPAADKAVCKKYC